MKKEEDERLRKEEREYKQIEPPLPKIIEEAKEEDQPSSAIKTDKREVQQE